MPAAMVLSGYSILLLRKRSGIPNVQCPHSSGGGMQKCLCAMLWVHVPIPQVVIINLEPTTSLTACVDLGH